MTRGWLSCARGGGGGQAGAGRLIECSTLTACGPGPGGAGEAGEAYHCAAHPLRQRGAWLSCSPYPALAARGFSMLALTCGLCGCVRDGVAPTLPGVTAALESVEELRKDSEGGGRGGRGMKAANGWRASKLAPRRALVPLATPCSFLNATRGRSPPASGRLRAPASRRRCIWGRAVGG
jgi:hypothetical protein